MSSLAYLTLAGSLLFAQGGGDLHRMGGGELRGGTYLSDFWAVEGELGVAEETAVVGAGVLGHWTCLELYDRYFGFSAFDPFVTLGAKGSIGRFGAVGPKAGVGAFYHFGEEWSLRADAEAMLDLEREVEVAYTLSVGLHYVF